MVLQNDNLLRWCYIIFRNRSFIFSINTQMIFGFFLKTLLKSCKLISNANVLIDWCLKPTIAVFQLYGGIANERHVIFCILQYLAQKPKPFNLFPHLIHWRWHLDFHQPPLLPRLQLTYYIPSPSRLDWLIDMYWAWASTRLALLEDKNKLEVILATRL